jgi:hypothetical protein
MPVPIRSWFELSPWLAPRSPPAALRRRARPLDLVERAGQQRAHGIGAREVEPRNAPSSCARVSNERTASARVKSSPGMLLRHPLDVPIEPGGQAECDLRGGFLGHGRRDRRRVVEIATAGRERQRRRRDRWRAGDATTASTARSRSQAELVTLVRFELLNRARQSPTSPRPRPASAQHRGCRQRALGVQPELLGRVPQLHGRGGC